MATISTLPVREKAGNKPSRSLTHPVHDPKGNKESKRRGKKQAEPLDPEELSRRLQAHIIQQKMRAEKRRASKAAAAAAEPKEVYHHVPQVAAAAFERTTTPEVMRQAHRLSQPAIKTHLEPVNVDDLSPSQPQTALQKQQALDQERIQRDILRARNQFQWNTEMEDAYHADVDRDLYKLPQRTFVDEFAYLRARKSELAMRRVSTGDVLWESGGESSPRPKPRAKSKPILWEPNDRNDWAQRDQAERRPSVKEMVGPLLKKRDSVWMLKSKKEKRGSVEKDIEAHAVLVTGGSPPETRRGSLFARFKRQPSD